MILENDSIHVVAVRKKVNGWNFQKKSDKKNIYSACTAEMYLITNQTMANCFKCGAHLEEDDDSLQGSGFQENESGVLVEVCNSCGAEQPIKKDYKEDVEIDAKIILLVRSGKYDSPDFNPGRYAWLKEQPKKYTDRVFLRANDISKVKKQS